MSDPRSSLADGVLEQRDGKDVLRFERRLPHPIERVWAALTEPDELIAWWGAADVELLEGGRFRLRWLNPDDDGRHVVLEATITQLEPPRVLEVSGEPHGVLRWELRAAGEGTELTFTSTLRLPERYRSMTLAGWHYHLDALADVLEGRRPDLVGLPNERWDRIHDQYVARLS